MFSMVMYGFHDVTGVSSVYLCHFYRFIQLIVCKEIFSHSTKCSLWCECKSVLISFFFQEHF